MSPGRHLKSTRRPAAQRLFEHGEAGSGGPLSLQFHPQAERAPHLLMRVGPRDLPHALTAIDAGAKPAGLVSGLNEHRDFTIEARRSCARLQLDWFCDPQLWKTALPGYRTSKQLQLLDYAPGRDAEPYAAAEFENRDLERQVGGGVVGAQFDAGANGVFGGAFVMRSPADPWLDVSLRMLRLGLAERDLLGARPLVATVPLDLARFTDEQDQDQLIKALSAHRPDAYLLMLSGLDEDSSSERIVAALRLSLLLQQSGVPVLISRVGALRHLLLAFGVRGVEFGLGRLLRFSIPDYSKKGGPGAEARFELPSLLGALKPGPALAALTAEVLPETNCECAGCVDLASASDQVSHAPVHAAHIICSEGSALEGVAPRQRVKNLERRLGEAQWRWQALCQAGVIEKPPRYLQRFEAAIELGREAGLLDPQRVARTSGLG